MKSMITSTAGICGGKPCIAGTRIRVQDIVLRTELGDSADDLVNAFPHITLADVHAALAYYYENQAAVDKQIRESDELISRIRAASGSGLLAPLKS